MSILMGFLRETASLIFEAALTIRELSSCRINHYKKYQSKINLGILLRCELMLVV